MQPVTFTDANARLAAPASWDDALDGPCGELSVRVLHNGDGASYFESAWRPSRAEIGMLLLGGVIVLRTVGVQPPVSLSVSPASTIEEPLPGCRDAAD